MWALPEPVFPALAGKFLTPGKPWKSLNRILTILFHFLVFLALPCAACGILVPRLGIEPRPPALRVQSANHWSTREFPLTILNNGRREDQLENYSEYPKV